MNNSLEVGINLGELCVSFNRCASTCTDFTQEECDALECRNSIEADCEDEATREATQAFFICLQERGCSQFPIGSVEYEKCEAKCTEIRNSTFEEEFDECIIRECGDDALATSQMVPIGFIAQVEATAGFGAISCQGNASSLIAIQAGIDQSGELFVTTNSAGNFQALPEDECYISNGIEDMFFSDDCIGCVELNYIILWANEDDLIDPQGSDVCVEFGPGNIMVCNG